MGVAGALHQARRCQSIERRAHRGVAITEQTGNLLGAGNACSMPMDEGQHIPLRELTNAQGFKMFVNESGLGAWHMTRL